MPSSSRIHFSRTHYEVKKLAAGAFADVLVAVPKSTADKIRSREKGTKPTTVYDSLRRHLVAVKFSQPQEFYANKAEEQLRNEIHVLTQVLPKKHERIIEVLGFHSTSSIKWLSTPFFTGGDVETFASLHPDCLTTAFVCHIAIHMIEALAFLVSGATNDDGMVVHGDWPCTVHGDKHLGNMLLRPATDRTGSFSNFPDIVLADFGCAKQDHLTGSKLAGSGEEYLPGSVWDSWRLASALLRLCGQSLAHDEAGGVYPVTKKLSGVQYSGPARVNRQGLLAVHRAAISMAKERRQECFIPSPSEVAASIAFNDVSDGDLEMMFCRPGNSARMPKRRNRL
ncbi:hypothetical protein KC327_g12439 [Hortaea werneckii]|nr:hypothetical protein KC358_g12285 [Hortaea werneckii]KAI6810922.1 hypothetical protein KC350_g12388 [Hortaea werneckii]KAI6819856.1 hypothetical protein KC342_g13852 [Hortaea werneckii]KAI6914794.1 hypothetical protein KC348_g12187 [Hortaea werneckii]KAI6928092.1 hypothetical protein KC341_g11742 [Hortaea werneckii]